MTYLFRLMCISLGSFFLLHAILGACVALAARAAIRLAQRVDARRAARFVLALRLLPATGAGLLVAALCVPSYLRLEPRSAPEGIGAACLAAAALGIGIWAIAVARGWRAVRRSIRAVEGPASPPMALAGVLKPRLVISPAVRRALSPEQLAAAVRHEEAHRASRDNLKRLLLVLAPDAIPFVNPWRALEQHWARFTEWAADDAASGGDANRSLALAEALVRVARVCPSPRPAPLVALLVGSGADLEARVERLLNPTGPAERGRRMYLAVGGGLAALACATVVLAFHPAVLAFVHEALERLNY